MIDRPNRFVMTVRLHEDEEMVEAYCPNTSRLIGLIENNPEVLLTRNSQSNRKTDYTVRCIKDRGHWVGIEASRANDLFDRYLKEDPIPPFSDWTEWTREVPFQDSQLDFRGITGDGDQHWVEVKSLSSRGRNNRSAFFSGTPSKRGWRHLGELEDAVQKDDRAHCVFVIQREDVVQLGPGEPTHPEWYRAIQSAHDNGVSIRAFRCERRNGCWSIKDPIPVIL